MKYHRIELDPANARLIAAAPDLLNEVHNARQIIQAVIDHLETGEPWSNSMVDDLKSELLGINLKITKATGKDDL